MTAANGSSIVPQRDLSFTHVSFRPVTAIILTVSTDHYPVGSFSRICRTNPTEQQPTTSDIGHTTTNRIGKHVDLGDLGVKPSWNKGPAGHHSSQNDQVLRHGCRQLWPFYDGLSQCCLTYPSAVVGWDVGGSGVHTPVPTVEPEIGKSTGQGNLNRSRVVEQLPLIQNTVTFGSTVRHTARCVERSSRMVALMC